MSYDQSYQVSSPNFKNKGNFIRENHNSGLRLINKLGLLVAKNKIRPQVSSGYGP